MISRGGRRKIHAPRRVGTADNANSFDDLWQILSLSLREIHTRNASKLSFEQLYRNAYKMVLGKQGDGLYNNVYRQERDWLTHNVQPTIVAAITSGLSADPGSTKAGSATNEFCASAEKLMKALKAAFEDHYTCMGMITDVLMYLDRVYCSENNRPYVMAMGMGQFREQILSTTLAGHEDFTVLRVLVEVILGLIDLERRGEIIDRHLIRSCIYMLEGTYETELEREDEKLYFTVFEPAFLAASRQHYRAESQRALQTMDASSFCHQAVARLAEESTRCRSMLSVSTLDKVKKVVDEHLIKNSLGTVINLPGSGVPFMVDNDRIDELSMVFDLSARVDPKKSDLKAAVQKRISETGHEINMAAKQAAQAAPVKAVPDTAPKADGCGKPLQERTLNQQTVAAVKWVDDVLRLKDKYDAIYRQSFREDKDLQAAATRSFTEFINVFERSSEYLSLFFDENLKKGLKGKTESEVDSLLDSGITLLRYVQDKDMFERYYKKHLSRRLLMKRTVSMDAERQMISKMKLEVGNNFTQRIESMFKDMTISEGLTSNYKDHVDKLGDTDMKRAEIDVNVLTSTMWPLEAMGSSAFTDGGNAPIIFPPAVDRVRNGFERFYLDKHSGRKLTWQANMGTADIRAHFPKAKTLKTRELNVSTYAMLILLLFNDLPSSGSLTCAEIQARTNIPMHDLTRNLQSLAVAPKTRVLIKEPMSKEVRPEDRFSFNDAFHSATTRVKIGVVSGASRVEDSDERKETEKKNNDTRAGIIEAAIVRIMKQRKQLDHTSLITEVIQQLHSRFLPDVAMLKKRIESLIEREYLDRDEDSDRPAYKYLA